MVSFKSEVGKTLYLPVKEENQKIFAHHIQKYLKFKTKTHKNSQKKTQAVKSLTKILETFFFWYLSLQARETTAKINKLNAKKFCTEKETINKVKRQSIEQEEKSIYKPLPGRRKFPLLPFLSSCSCTNNKTDTRQIIRRKRNKFYLCACRSHRNRTKKMAKAGSFYSFILDKQ